MSKDVLFIITNVFLKYVIILSSIKRELWNMHIHWELWNMHIHWVRGRKQVYCPWRQQWNSCIQGGQNICNNRLISHLISIFLFRRKLKSSAIQIVYDKQRGVIVLWNKCSYSDFVRAFPSFKTKSNAAGE